MKRIANKLGLAAVALACAAGCHAARKPLANLVNVADLARASQLLGGFYDIEKPPARWSARKFAVMLRPPAEARGKGSRLWLRLYLPQNQIDAIGPMTLCADVDGYPLAPETFTKGGLFDFSRDVPAEWVDTNVVPVHFTFDRAAPPTSADQRELGAVITEVGLLKK